MAGASRAVTARHTVPRPRGDGESFVLGVRAAVQSGKYAMVFGSGDDWMAAVSTYRSRIPALNPHPPANVVSNALDKVRLAEHAAAAGLSTPLIRDADEASIQSWRGPVIVKSRAHWNPGQTRQTRMEARTYPTISAAEPRIRDLQAAGAQPVLQTPVAGRLSALIGIFDRGRLTARVQQESTRLWPTPNGISTRAVTVPVDEVLASRAERLLAGLGWRGLVELQFLIDSHSTYHLIDLNGRFFGSMRLADAARPGMIDLWGHLTLGIDHGGLPDGVPGLRYAWTAGDLRRAVVERRGGYLRDVADTLRWAATSRHSVWQLSDLGPTMELVKARIPGRRHDVREPRPRAPSSG